MITPRTLPMTLVNDGYLSKPVPRDVFFNLYWKELEAKGWPAAILHTWENLPEQIDSDVDYVIGGTSAGELPRFLDNFCQRHGWVLAQVMEHEPNAFYCVCFMEKSPWASLKLDVAWDYQRKGRTLLPGSILLAKRYKPPGKTFYVPAPASEFTYILAKGMAKSKNSDLIIRRLETLWNSDARACTEALDKWFRIDGDRSQSVFPAEQIESALQPYNRRFKKWRSRRWCIDNLLWLTRRLKRPYGVTFALNPEIDRDEFAKALLPAFRRVHLLESAPNRWQRLKMEYRSGLIVFHSRPEVKISADILDLRHYSTVDLCVLKALETMARNGSRNED
jgi:hypothetical protein